MHLSKFVFSRREDPINIIEGFTNGNSENGFATVYLTRGQVSVLLDTLPCRYKFLDAETKSNSREYPVLQIELSGRRKIIESSPVPTDNGDILEGYSMDEFCFVEIVKQDV